MLLLSLGATALVQGASAVIDLRGRNLQAALTTLLEQAYPEGKAQAADLARRVVGHHALKAAYGRAKAIRCSELLQALEGEPALASLKPGVEKWFDAVMDRSSDWFIAKTRVITVAAAFLLAIGLHVDSIDLVRRLARDPDLRIRLAGMADTVSRRAEEGLALAPQAGADHEAIARLSGSIDRIRRDLELEIAPGPGRWLERSPTASSLAGVALSALFLSLGAPFWYNALRQLAALKPVLARKVAAEAAAAAGLPPPSA
jgi:hypothetical protein